MLTEPSPAPLPAAPRAVPAQTSHYRCCRWVITDPVATLPARRGRASVQISRVDTCPWQGELPGQVGAGMRQRGCTSGCTGLKPFSWGFSQLLPKREKRCGVSGGSAGRDEPGAILALRGRAAGRRSSSVRGEQTKAHHGCRPGWLCSHGGRQDQVCCTRQFRQQVLLLRFRWGFISRGCFWDGSSLCLMCSER